MANFSYLLLELTERIRSIFGGGKSTLFNRRRRPSHRRVGP